MENDSISSLWLPAANSPVIIPALFARSAAAQTRFSEFFTARTFNVTNRKVYGRAIAAFSAWCDEHHLMDLRDIEPVHVAAYVEGLHSQLAASSIKVQLTAIRLMFDWLLVDKIVAVNPAASVRGPSSSANRSKRPALTANQAQRLLDFIDIGNHLGLRDRALLALMVYNFVPLGSALKMRVADVYVQARRTWVRLDGNDGNALEMPCDHLVAAYLHAYIEAAAITAADECWLFRKAIRRTTQLSECQLSRPNAHHMIRCRALEAGVFTKISNHSFSASRITEFLRNCNVYEKRVLDDRQ